MESNRLMHRDPKYLKGPCSAPTLFERDRVLNTIIPGVREAIRTARDRKDTI